MKCTVHYLPPAVQAHKSDIDSTRNAQRKNRKPQR